MLKKLSLITLGCMFVSVLFCGNLFAAEKTEASIPISPYQLNTQMSNDDPSSSIPIPTNDIIFNIDNDAEGSIPVQPRIVLEDSMLETGAILVYQGIDSFPYSEYQPPINPKYICKSSYC